jgi:hypothetical protein
MRQEVIQAVQLLQNAIATPSEYELTYIAQPYSHKSKVVQVRRLGIAVQFVDQILHEEPNVLPFSPICCGYPVSLYSDRPASFDGWRTFNMGMLSRCDSMRILAVPGWKNSVGLSAELDFAMVRGIPRTYWTYINDRVEEITYPQAVNVDEV